MPPARDGRKTFRGFQSTTALLYFTKYCTLNLYKILCSTLPVRSRNECLHKGKLVPDPNGSSVTESFLHRTSQSRLKPYSKLVLTAVERTQVATAGLARFLVQGWRSALDGAVAGVGEQYGHCGAVCVLLKPGRAGDSPVTAHFSQSALVQLDLRLILNTSKTSFPLVGLFIQEYYTWQ